jgi:tetratricopeptide (TPR) repeat protein
LVSVQRAYDLMNIGDDCISAERFEDALLAYRGAAQLVPDIEELPFWQAVTMAEIGRLEEALPIFHHVFETNPVWRTMVQRLPPSGLLRDDPEMMGRILAA